MHFHVQHWISHYGYIGVFFILLVEMIGIPFPAATTLTISGFLWMKGAFSLVPLLLGVLSGIILGSTISYGIGFYLGRPAIVRFGRYIGITEARLNAADKKFNEYRTAVVLFSKFVAGIRVVVPYLAGINRMPFGVFSLFNSISAVMWVAFFIFLGGYVEIVWARYHKLLHLQLVPAVIVIALVVCVMLALKDSRE